MAQKYTDHREVPYSTAVGRTETYLIDEVVSQCMQCHRSDLGCTQSILHIL